MVTEEDADDNDDGIKKTLVWHKLGVDGYKPAAREGHTCVSYDGKVFMFGGVETGRRVNSVQVLDVPSQQWSAHAVGNRLHEKEAQVLLDANSEDELKMHTHIGQASEIDSKADLDWETQIDDIDIPMPRNQHAACVVKYWAHSANANPVGAGKAKAWMIVHGGEGASISITAEVCLCLCACVCVSPFNSLSP